MFKKMIQWAHRPPAPAHQLEYLEKLPQLPALQDFEELTDGRLVVVDLETSGLNTRKDIVLAIGAVAIEQGAIDLTAPFEVVLQQPALKVDDTILIHGLGPETLASGVAPEEGLRDFLDWAGAAVLVAFHSPFDQRMLERALRSELGISRKYVWLDMAMILPALFTGAAVGQGQLDDWLAYFKLDISNRHNASADALATAELLLIAIREARNQGIDSLAGLEEKARYYKRLYVSRRRF